MADLTVGQNEDVTEVVENGTAFFRIHGDNILECEYALHLVAQSQSSRPALVKSPAYASVYKITRNGEDPFYIQLLPGYGRWGFEIVEYLYSRGAPLREATDALITKIYREGQEYYEQPILALEFCGALPAGNNAWQRTGRAVSAAFAGIPYLYYAELGGVELDANREIKAARFPNPIVPFAYLELNKASKTLALPIYAASPSIDRENYDYWKDAFGSADALKLIHGVVSEGDIGGVRERLERKAIRTAQLLTESRRNKASILDANEWEHVHNLLNSEEKLGWFLDRKMRWNKKVGIKSATESFHQLLEGAKDLGAVALGSVEMPFCAIDGGGREQFLSLMIDLYGDRLSSEFTTWMEKRDVPLICVWVAGFKPRGEDSRPDRGLVPLVRMLLGDGDYDLLSIVYGPAPKSSLKQLQEDMEELARVNGLWESVLKLSDAVLIDGGTSKDMNKLSFVLNMRPKRIDRDEPLPIAASIPSFGEHDIDSTLHSVLSHAEDDVFEGMCNPPGGDWSGISLLDFNEGRVYRWTSLPRVSGENTKRPDHLLEFKTGDYLLSIESKDQAARLESGIGPRLAQYVEKLLDYPPISFRKRSEEYWKPFRGAITDLTFGGLEVYTGAAFIGGSEPELVKTLERGETDIVFRLEFNGEKGNTTIYLVSNNRARAIVKQLAKIIEGSPYPVSVKIR